MVGVNMGGPKKRPISAIEKAQRKRLEARKREEAAKAAKGPYVYLVEEKVMQQILKEVPKMKYITPYLVSSKYGVRYSVAKDILEDLAKNGVLRLHAKNRRLAIYVPAAA